MSSKKKNTYLAIVALTLCLVSVATPIPVNSTKNRAAGPADELRIRKDIREIENSTTELKNLRHAFLMLKKNPKTCSDPNAKNEYDCWAAYHNNFDLYGCRHNLDLFWPWHRYHLSEFEQALRASDPANPERVANVTLPYWNWSQRPSGRFFPKSVEQRELLPGEYYPEDCPDTTKPCLNPLWIDGRREATECQSIKAECIQEAVRLETWREFGGGERAGQTSDFELQAHNFMHSRYIGGAMADPLTASKDPIYWFFHSYIDFVWDQWQVAHQTDQCDIRNIPNATRVLRIGDWPPASTQFQSVACTKNLGYKYATFGPIPAAALPSCPPPRAGCAAQNPETLVSFNSFKVANEFNRAQIKLSGVSIPADFSYDAAILIHPASSSYKPGNTAFLDKYIATYFVVWKHGHRGPKHAAHGKADQTSTMEVELDVTDKIRKLLTANSSADFATTIVFSPSNKKERSNRLTFRKDFTFTSAAVVVDNAIIQLKPTK